MDCTSGKAILDADAAGGLGSVSIGAEAEQEDLPVAIRQPVYQVINQAKEVRRSARLKLLVREGKLAGFRPAQQRLEFSKCFLSTVRPVEQHANKEAVKLPQPLYAQTSENAFQADGNRQVLGA
jgi:hypothetical protein